MRGPWRAAWTSAKFVPPNSRSGTRRRRVRSPGRYHRSRRRRGRTSVASRMSRLARRGLRPCNGPERRGRWSLRRRGCVGLPSDLGRDAPTVPRRRDRSTRPLRIVLVVIEGPPLGPVVDRRLVENQSTVLAGRFHGIRSNPATALGTAADRIARYVLVDCRS